MTNSSTMLSCPSCGNRFQVTRDIDRFSCEQCGKELVIRRENGIVYLGVVTEDMDASKKTGVSKVKKKGKRWPWIVGAIVFLFLCNIISNVANPNKTPAAIRPKKTPIVTSVKVAAISNNTPSSTSIIVPTQTPLLVVTPTNAGTATNTPPPTATPLPTATNTPLPPAPKFTEIRANMLKMTDAQWDVYKNSLKGLGVVHWTGWVEDVSSHLFGGYELMVDMDSPDEPLSVQDVTFDIPNDLALKLSKDSQVTFSGKVNTVLNIFGSLQVNLSDVTVELK